MSTNTKKMEPLPKTPILDPRGEVFTWGPIQKIHDFPGLGLKIVEFLADNSGLYNPSEDTYSEHGKPAFHGYSWREGPAIWWRDSQTLPRLDSCVVHMIDVQRRGLNSQAARHFDLMTLGVIPGEHGEWL